VGSSRGLELFRGYVVRTVRGTSSRPAASLVAVACGVVALASAAGGGEAGGVVAMVNGEFITRDELLRELMVRHGKAVLEDLIRQKAIDQEVRRARVTVSEDEVENELKRERKHLAAIEARRVRASPESGPVRTLEDMAQEKYHMSFDGYRGIVKRWLLIRKMILRRETAAENEVMLWFYKNRERYDEPAEVSVRHILILKEEPGTGRLRTTPELDRIKALVRRGLLDGTDFGALAMRYSEDSSTRLKGGDLGTINERVARATLEPSFVDAMMALKPGQSGGPIETPKGFHFLHVSARQEGHRVEYGRIKARVRVDYLEERALLLREVFIRELMDRAKVQRFLEFDRTEPRQ